MGVVIWQADPFARPTSLGAPATVLCIPSQKQSMAQRVQECKHHQQQRQPPPPAPRTTNGPLGRTTDNSVGTCKTVVHLNGKIEGEIGQWHVNGLFIIVKGGLQKQHPQQKKTRNRGAYD